jgi:large subunit ribosomal protein L5
MTTEAAAPPIEPRLRAMHRDELTPQLMREFNYTNAMQVPTLSKIAVNIGLGEALDNANAIESATCAARAPPSRTSSCARATRSAWR